MSDEPEAESTVLSSPLISSIVGAESPEIEVITISRSVDKTDPGLGQKFRRHNQAELDIADGLEKEESRDLGIHLYNAFSLKRRYKSTADIGRNVRRRTASEGFETEDEEGREGGDDHDDLMNIGWRPRTIWTAWPLRLVDQTSTSSGYEPLQGQSALMQHKSGWKPSQQLEDCLLSEILARSRSQFKISQSKDDRDGHSHDRMNDVEIEENVSNSLGADLMIDEEEARKISKSFIRHTISRFEDFLRGLSESRRNQGGNIKPSSQNGTETEGEDTDHTTNSTSTRINRITRTPRDWKEVLGWAALSGWDKRVVKQTIDKCNALFDGNVDPTLGSTEYDTRMQTNLYQDLCSALALKRKPSTGSLACPHEWCSRHDKPFARRDHLQRHLRTRHSEKHLETSSLPARNIFKAVPIDDILHPILPSEKWMSPEDISTGAVPDLGLNAIPGRAMRSRSTDDHLTISPEPDSSSESGVTSEDVLDTSELVGPEEDTDEERETDSTSNDDGSSEE